MARLHYFAATSLDHYHSDAAGNFDWAAPDEEVHAFVNDLCRPWGTALYGRRMYEIMAVWETLDEPEPVMQDFARIWKASDKVVYSRTLEGVSTPRTRLERTFDPQAVQALKDRSDRDLSVGGPHLAAAAIRAGLVDDWHQLLVPVLIGGGNRSLPDGVRVPLELVEERRFADGTVYLRHRTRR